MTAATATADSPIIARNVRASHGDGAAYSVMVGFGETYFAAFALAAGLSQAASGLVTAVPLIIGGTFQLAAPRLSRRIGSYKKWVLLCATLQALAHLPLCWFAWQGRIPMIAMFAIASLYWAGGMAAGPVWNNWIDAIIPKEGFRKFLATRSRITQAFAFVAFLCGGVLLHRYETSGQSLRAFMILFVAAGLARMISIGFLAWQTDAPSMPVRSPFAPMKTIVSLFQNDGSRFLVYMLMCQAAVNYSGPFFTPYMLKQLNFNYAEYTALISAAFIAKILTYPVASRLIDRYGAYRCLWVCGIIISPLPMFWILTPYLSAVIAVQVVAGAAWASFELASTILIFDRIPPQDRIRVITAFNFLNAVAVVSGSILGGLVLTNVQLVFAYPLLFFGSAAGRFASLTMLFGTKKVVTRLRTVAMRTIGLRPSQGSVSQPVLSRQTESGHGSPD